MECRIAVYHSSKLQFYVESYEQLVVACGNKSEYKRSINNDGWTIQHALGAQLEARLVLLPEPEADTVQIVPWDVCFPSRENGA